MRWWNTHKIPVTVTLVVLFLAASSGFTAVVHFCKMPEKSCCSGSVGHTKMPSEAQVGRMVAECCVTTVMGGLITAPMISEKQQGEKTQQITAVSPLAGARMHGVFPQTSQSFFLRTPAEASPPAVERYLLNVSFLI